MSTSYSSALCSSVCRSEVIPEHYHSRADMCRRCTRAFQQRYSLECPVCETECGFAVEVSATSYWRDWLDRYAHSQRPESFYRTYPKVLHCHFNSSPEFALPVTVAIGWEKGHRSCSGTSDHSRPPRQFSLLQYECRVRGDMIPYYSYQDWTISLEDCAVWETTERAQRYQRTVWRWLGQHQ